MTKHPHSQFIIKTIIHPRMKELGITKYRISKLTGIAESNIGRWLKGDQDITLEKFKLILVALGIEDRYELIEGFEKEYWVIFGNEGPCCVYSGLDLKKDGTLRKGGSRRQCWQYNEVKK